MNYDTTYIPTTREAEAFTTYIAMWENKAGDGEAMTYDEIEFDDYERQVLLSLEGNWETETDDVGVYLRKSEVLQGDGI
jgi:hypothetical protein